MRSLDVFIATLALAAALPARPALAQTSPEPVTGAPESSSPLPSSASPAPASSPSPMPASSAPHAVDTERADASAEGEGVQLRIEIPGEWQVRGIALSPIPLQTTPGQTMPSTLGQTSYAENWFRFTPEVRVGDFLRLVIQLDIARGIIFGDSTQQVEFSRDNRAFSDTISQFPRGVVDVRWGYIEWTSPIGVIRVGQQPNHWGLGIVANDGNHTPTFGDYRMGDIVERVAFATRPLGRNSDLVVALAGDLVYRDQYASLVEYSVPSYDGTPDRTLGGDMVWQGVLAAFYQAHDCHLDCERKRIGFYAAYRDWSNRLRPGDYLDAFIGDVYARWEWPTPDGLARVFAAAEAVGIGGSTNFAATAAQPQQNIIQFGGATELGLVRDQRYRITIAGGYASGNANPIGTDQTRFTFNPDYHVGLILFPELLAWNTARSASIAVDARIMNQPAAGASLLPTSGGVAGAMYFNPTAVVNLTHWLDVRAGMVVAAATTDVVDPVRFTLYGSPQNYYGGDSHARDLGIEFDLALMGRIQIAPGLALTGGAQGAIALPGHAFDDASGHGVGPLGLVRGVAGVSYY